VDLPVPMTPQFEEDYLAFMARYSPGRKSVVANREFVERLRHLLELAARGAAVSAVEPAKGPTGSKMSDRLTLVPLDLRRMRLRHAGWIARLKREEEMGASIAWPING
jgi:hypothetical protein